MNAVYVASVSQNYVTYYDVANSLVHNYSTGSSPFSVAVNPSSGYVYVANNTGGNVYYYSTNYYTAPYMSNVGTPSVGSSPTGVAVDPIANIVYVTNYGSDTVTMLDASNASVINTVNLLPSSGAIGIAIR